jgi:hypothetical protein
MSYIHYKNFKKIIIHKQNTLQKIHQEVTLTQQHKKIKQQFLFSQKKLFSYLQIDNKESRNAEILAAILRSGEINNVMINLLNPIQWKKKLNLNQGILHLAIDGQVSAIWNWLSWIMNLEIPMVINELKIQRATENLLHSEIEILTFFIPSSISGKRIQSLDEYQLELSQRNFFNSSSTPISLNDPLNYQNEMLHNISIKQIQWVGYLHQDQKTWAIAQLPNHKTIAVTLQSKLGFENAKIISISPENIIIEMQGKRAKITYGNQHEKSY